MTELSFKYKLLFSCYSDTGRVDVQQHLRDCNYDQEANYPGIIWKAIFSPSELLLCVRQKGMLGREQQQHCHHLSMVTRWCASTTVMLWSCSYATWRTDLAVGLFILLCVFYSIVLALRDTTPPIPHPSPLRVWLLTSSWSCGYRPFRCAQTWERLLGEDEPCLFGALLQIFMCSWNWFHMSWGQPASADFLIKLNRERGGRDSGCTDL